MEQHRCHGCMKLIEEAVCPHCGYGEGKANTENQLPAGTVLQEKYLVGKALGQGGFGITYIGCDLDLDLVVAIKEFFPVALVNRDSGETLTVKVNAPDLEDKYHQNRSRFLKEAKALAKLQDVPQIVGIRGFFEENGTAYIVMEYVQGMDLRHYVRKQGGRLTPEQLFPLMDPVLQALDRVHKARLVHRDVSPDNIMILPDGGVKLLDFGAVRDAGGSDADIDLSHSTEAILKHGFAPMEQYRSRGNLGPWTDEYGICASAYYCLTGRVPPDAPSRAMGEAEVDWNAVPGLEKHQRTALEKGMSMRAKDRFGDLEALRTALMQKPETGPEEDSEDEEDFEKIVVVRRFGFVPLLVALVMTAGICFAGLRFVSQLQLGDVLGKVGLTQEIVTDYVLLQSGLGPEPTEPIAEEGEASVQTDSTEPTEYSTKNEPWHLNQMMRRPLEALEAVGIPRESIQRAVFLDTLEGAPDNTIDVSLRKNGAVLAWVDWSSGCTVYFAAEGGINGRVSCENLFDSCSSLTTVTFGDAYHTDDCQNMSDMFFACVNLETVDLDRLNTRKVQDMSQMFCLMSWRVKNMTTQYTYNEKITSLDLSSWDMADVRYLQKMFYGCKALKEVNTTGWDLSKSRDMTEMFALSGLETLDAGHWKLNPSLALDLGGMFRDCANLKYVNTSGWNTERVVDLAYMFSGCENLQTVDVSGWNLKNVKTISGMFLNCRCVTGLNTSNWNTIRISDMHEAFSGCWALDELDVSGWQTGIVKDMGDMFYDCPNLTQLQVGGWTVTNALNMKRMFSGSGIYEADVGSWNVSRTLNMEEMFYNCMNLEDLDLGDWQTNTQLKYNNFCSEWTRINDFTWQEFFWNRK